MEKVLAQKDIDALFAMAAPVKAKDPASAVTKPYNFGQAGVISGEQMKSISTVNDLFARNLMHTGGAWLRTDFQVSLAAGEQMPFSEYLDRVPDPAYVCSLRLEPLGAIGLLALDLALASPIVDLLLGGTGKAGHARLLTDIEELIMLSVTQLFVKELNTAWSNVGLQFHFEKRETPAQILRMLPMAEKTICICFEITMPEARGVLTLCLPAMVVNTTLRRRNAEDERPRRRSAESRTRMQQLVGDVSVGAVLQFPAIRLSARELAALKLGSVLRLPVPRHAPAELRVGGLAYGAARPVKVGEHRGASMELVSAEGGQ